MSRHNFGTLITLSQGVPLETVSRIMGHLGIKTSQLYAKLTNQKINEDMKLLSSNIWLISSIFMRINRWLLRFAHQSHPNI